MKRSVALVSGLFALLALFAIQSPASAQDTVQEIDGLLKIYHDCGNFNGAALVARRGEVIYRKGFGFANMEWEAPNTPDTKFRIGSMTKQFTAMLIMQLVEKRKVKLEAPISTYLPDYRADIGEKVTVHHLLTHTSGIPSYTAMPGYIQHVSRQSYAVDEFIGKYCSRDLEFAPGSKHAYSNSGYFLLGAIIEKATGRTYEEMLKANILDPVGMKNSGYDHPEIILKKRASGYGKTKTGYGNAPYVDMSVPFSAGAMYSTVDDLYLWDQALYTERLLSQKYKEIMFMPGLGNAACGWFVRKVSVREGGPTVNVISHGGAINGFGSTIWRMTDDKDLIVLLINAGPANPDQIALAILKILHADKTEK